jgi:hyperosmotically inducible periplasmic protein
MNRKMPRLSRLILASGLFVFGVPMLAMPVAMLQDTQQPMPDNTKKNKDQSEPTADQQKMNPADRAITQKIRKAIHEDGSLSTYAHNVKVITQNGKVTLRGPVRTEAEKSNIQAKAAAVAGEENVSNQLEITPQNK